MLDCGSTTPQVIRNGVALVGEADKRTGELGIQLSFPLKVGPGTKSISLQRRVNFRFRGVGNDDLQGLVVSAAMSRSSWVVFHD